MFSHSASQWLTTGDDAFAAMLGAISQAQREIRMEMYIFEDDSIGTAIRNALVLAAKRGVKVQLLLDALGCEALPNNYWDDFTQSGGIYRRFNPLELRRLPVRNHRKLLVCDSDIAFVGGFNIAAHYEGDGVQRGWRDLGVGLCGPIVPALAESFDQLFATAEVRPKRFTNLRRVEQPPALDPQPGCQLLLGVPGRGRSAIQSSLIRDLSHAERVRLVVPYFLPGARLRRAIQGVVRRGGRVQLLMPGKTDVALSKLAAQSLYSRLLRSGIEIFEYQPQILHAKLFWIDDAVYVGSSNLDTRSLHLNYELLVRLTDSHSIQAAQAYVEDSLRFSLPIDPIRWRQSRSLWTRLHERWAFLLLARLDPLIARWLTPSE